MKRLVPIMRRANALLFLHAHVLIPILDFYLDSKIRLQPSAVACSTRRDRSFLNRVLLELQFPVKTVIRFWLLAKGSTSSASWYVSSTFFTILMITCIENDLGMRSWCRCRINTFAVEVRKRSHVSFVRESCVFQPRQSAHFHCSRYAICNGRSHYQRVHRGALQRWGLQVRLLF